MRAAALGSAAAIATVLVSSSCATLPPSPTPMRQVHLRPDAGGSPRCVVVMLPGRGGHAEDFVSAGFAPAMWAQGVQVEAIAAEATLGYYAARTMETRLRDDVVAPARAAGHDRVWLVGASMGGLGTLIYAMRHPEGVAGVVVLAPYLGERAVVEEIAAAGGLRAWVPQEPFATDDFARPVWKHLIRYATGDRTLPPLYVGWGRSDRLAPAARLLADVLPPGHAFEVGGGHTWKAWRAAWGAFLGSGALARDCT